MVWNQLFMQDQPWTNPGPNGSSIGGNHCLYISLMPKRPRKDPLPVRGLGLDPGSLDRRTCEQRLLFAVVKISLGAFLFYSPMSDLVCETR